MSELKNILSKNIDKHVTLNASPLHEQYLFRWAVISPIIISLIVFLFTHHGVLNFWNGADQKTLVDNSKLPLLIAALSPILGSIISNLHRTVQTDKQIKEAGKKNVVDSFISHQKLCIENFKLIDNSMNITWFPPDKGIEKLFLEVTFCMINPSALYKKLFPENNLRVGAVSYHPATSVITDINNALDIEMSRYLTDEALSNYESELYKKLQSYDPTISEVQMNPIVEVATSLTEEAFKLDFNGEYANYSYANFFVMTINVFEKLLSKYYIIPRVKGPKGEGEMTVVEALNPIGHNILLNDSSSFVCKSAFYLIDSSLAVGLEHDVERIYNRIISLSVIMNCFQALYTEKEFHRKRKS